MARSATVHKLHIHQHRLPNPRTFTKAEQVIKYMSDLVIMQNTTYAKIAEGVGVAGSTIGNLANGKTRWPRPTTLFPLMHYLNVHLEIRSNDESK